MLNRKTRVWAMVVSLVILLSVTGAISVFAADSYLENGDFAAGIEGWTQGGTGTAIEDTGAAKLTNVANGTTTLQKPLKLTAAKNDFFQVSFSIKANVTEGEGAKLIVYRDNGTTAEAQSYPIADTNGAWEEISFSYQQGANQKNKITLQLTGIGDVWFDNISFVRITETDNMLINGTAENTNYGGKLAITPYSSADTNVFNTNAISSTDQAYEGMASFTHEKFIQMFVTLEKGATYKLSLMSKNTLLTTRDIYLSVSFDASGPSEQIADRRLLGTTPANGDWTLLTYYLTVPADATFGVNGYSKLFLSGTTPGNVRANQTVFYDNLSLVKVEEGFMTANNQGIMEGTASVKSFQSFVPAAASADVFVAAYIVKDGKVTLAGISTMKTATGLTVGTKNTVESNVITLPEAGTGETILLKSFVWDSINGLKPFTNASNTLTIS
ncbi:MAG: hypothetical protein PUB07_05675 [Clostridia bacterium]|nr:hypothetical protein [Clostridia bacterium]